MHNFSLTCTTSNWRAQLPPNMQWTASSSECRWCCWKSLGPLFSSPSSKGRAGILCKHNGTVWNTMKHDDIVCTMMKHENTWKQKKTFENRPLQTVESSEPNKSPYPWELQAVRIFKHWGCDYSLKCAEKLLPLGQERWTEWLQWVRCLQLSYSYLSLYIDLVSFFGRQLFSSVLGRIH